MGILGMFDKLDDIIYKPVDALTEWIKEPLKEKENKRSVELLEKRNELKIKEETEITRINAEIEEWKKDKHLERLNRVGESLTRYQKELSKINTDAIQVIGNMQLELRGKAQDMILEKTQRYKEIQNQATQEAMNDFLKIEENFSQNEAVKNILHKQIDNRLSNIIDSARDFMSELNSDLNNLNQDISKLTEFGQKSVEKLMDRFRAVGNPNEYPRTESNNIIDVEERDFPAISQKKIQ